MTGTIRSGRATIAATTTKTVVMATLSGNHVAMYRFINGGKEGTTVEIRLAGSKVHDLAWGDSVDLGVTKQDISVTAGAKEAEIVFEFLGLA